MLVGMSTAARIEELLALPDEDRAEIAGALMDSLDRSTRSDDVELEWERRWAAEAERRLDEYQRGVVQAVSAQEAIAAARARLKSKR